MIRPRNCHTTKFYYNGQLCTLPPSRWAPHANFFVVYYPYQNSFQRLQRVQKAIINFNSPARISPFSSFQISLELSRKFVLSAKRKEKRKDFLGACQQKSKTYLQELLKRGTSTHNFYQKLFQQ